MATERSGTPLEDSDQLLPSEPELGGHIPKRHARVTVKYNRKELQRRLDVEKWIDESLDRLYRGQESDMPEEVNIDDLIDLQTDDERVHKLKELLHNCSNNTETFIKELVEKLVGVHKQNELQSEGIEHPIICHSVHRHEPYHFHNAQPHIHHTQRHNQSL
ncbi:protein phosphatase 1, regulatory (inhibitor) subunit 14Aa [Cyprinodon tularosa]|uniref:protein phosphatase 1, regulatory (inhibitor) subunit 14Aa n=1 Tax=Cyprinodon tularosa TaxID=77115 RepID=UPI0018E28900|nr:protein phosphatase 1, regulatory (inhibitor) subunit 14Aa [Cyprinodon tularosa]